MWGKITRCGIYRLVTATGQNATIYASGVNQEQAE